MRCKQNRGFPLRFVSHKKGCETMYSTVEAKQFFLSFTAFVALGRNLPAFVSCIDVHKVV